MQEAVLPYSQGPWRSHHVSAEDVRALLEVRWEASVLTFLATTLTLCQKTVPSTQLFSVCLHLP